MQRGSANPTRKWKRSGRREAEGSGSVQGIQSSQQNQKRPRKLKCVVLLPVVPTATRVKSLKWCVSLCVFLFLIFGREREGLESKDGRNVNLMEAWERLTLKRGSILFHFLISLPFHSFNSFHNFSTDDDDDDHNDEAAALSYTSLANHVVHLMAHRSRPPLSSPPRRFCPTTWLYSGRWRNSCLCHDGSFPFLSSCSFFFLMFVSPDVRWQL